MPFLMILMICQIVLAVYLGGAIYVVREVSPLLGVIMFFMTVPVLALVNVGIKAIDNKIEEIWGPYIEP